MPENLAGKTINRMQRQRLITMLPCFAMLSPEESQELAECMAEVCYAVGEKIVEENTLIDSVYILVQGQAEVVRLIPKSRKIKITSNQAEKIDKVPLAILNAGESIGLNDSGFFSTTGKRTATVIALSNVLVLCLDLKRLHDFFHQHPPLQSAIYACSGQILRAQLIKQSLPFSQLSHERLMWLSNQVEEIYVPPGTVIFEEGDVGDCCYLIRSGQVEIFTKQIDELPHQLAVLQAPAVFGEATLITRATRNATARALSDCDLFKLDYQYLLELLESEKNIARTFMTLMVDRSRPLQNSHVEAHQFTTTDQQIVVILKNPDNGSYFKLSEEGWFIWQQMNGQQTMQEITMALTDEYNVFAPDVVAALISKFAKAGFVTNIKIDNGAYQQKQPIWKRIILKVKHLLQTRIVIGDADTWLTQFYHKGAFLLFNKISKIIMTCIMVLGFLAFALSTSQIIELFRTIHHSWALIILFIPFTLLSVALHELGHALAIKSYGHEVHYMGVGWQWIMPVAFIDTSDMWLDPRRAPRIFVNLAGVFADVLVAGVFSLFIFLIPIGYIQVFLWLFALFTYLSAFRMLNPLQELDGYYVLVDLFDRPHLRKSAVVWLVEEFPKAIRNPEFFKKNIPAILYWLACIVFLLLISLLVWLIQTFVLTIFGFEPNNFLVTLALPVMIGFISCFGIIADVRQQAEE